MSSVFASCIQFRCPDTAVASSVKTANVFSTSRLGRDRFQVNIHATIQGQGVLQAFQLSKDTQDQSRWTVKPVFSIQADAALPVICTRPGILDLVILRRGTLELVTGHGQTVPLRLPAMSDFTVDNGQALMTPPLRASQKIPVSLTGIRRVSGSRVVAISSDGLSAVLDCDNTPRNATVNQILKAMGCVLPVEPMTIMKMNILTHIQRCNGKGFDTLQLMGQALLVSLGFKEKATPSPLSPWLRLQNRGREKQAVTNASGHSEEVSADAMFGTLALNWVPYILQALHMIGQECILRTSRRAQLELLVPIILTLAEHLRLPLWIDYWKRRLPDLLSIQMVFPCKHLACTDTEGLHV
jgi:hypothetical protein